MGVHREERSVLDAPRVGAELPSAGFDDDRRRQSRCDHLARHLRELEQRIFARAERGPVATPVRRQPDSGEAPVEQRHVAPLSTAWLDDPHAEVEAPAIGNLDVGDEIEVPEDVRNGQRTALGNQERVVGRTDEVEVAIRVDRLRPDSEEQVGQETGQGAEHPVFEEALATAACRTRHGQRAIIGSPPRW